MKFCGYNFVLNKRPNNNDATCVVNNVRLTTVGAQQFSMVAISCRKANLPETRDKDTITRKVRADRNKILERMMAICPVV